MYYKIVMLSSKQHSHDKIHHCHWSKIFSNYIAQSNYSIIQTKFLTVLLKNNNEVKEYSRFIKTQKFKKREC